MKLVKITEPGYETMQEIVKIEEEAFDGAGNVDLWIIKALIRYGLVFVVEIDGKIISIIEYMQSFNKKTVFLYGISTLKKYRHRGYANFLLLETEKYLKSLDFKEIELTVDPNNKIAIKMYKKNGYIQDKLLKDEYGKNIDRYVMKKIL
ncbi:MAG: GNAT family N-acetyltransferase [Fusobacterium sp.]|uniref:GNAT family N-acetyltransferase n=1 Tax=Fusobacterium sp. TaxID=68766 RepID=UPI0026DB4A3C|nr:GNAT family N-acetyltransferase [Fusobacterium sp.]MDO4691147.1 GNAT family N-acetyltransferase [Fusobacterium sp.]